MIISQTILCRGSSLGGRVVCIVFDKTSAMFHLNRTAETRALLRTFSTTAKMPKTEFKSVAKGGHNKLIADTYRSSNEDRSFELSEIRIMSSMTI